MKLLFLEAVPAAEVVGREGDGFRHRFCGWMGAGKPEPQPASAAHRWPGRYQVLAVSCVGDLGSPHVSVLLQA